MAATSTYKSFLMVKGDSGSTYTKLIDIKEYPDMGGSPNMLEITTLSDKMTKNILGIQQVDALEFTANYDATDFAKLDAIATAGTEKEFALWFGGTESNGVVTPTGSDGKFTFTGTLSVYVNGGGVDEVREMTITIAASTVIAFESGT